VKALGASYRRIPLMSIGRDVYCDTRIILQKLEKHFPNSTLGASDPDGRALQKLLEIWAIDGGIFNRAAQLIPSTMPLLNDPKFTKDREDFSGRSWDKNQIEAFRAEALAHIRGGFTLLETTLLADDRDWILKTEKPSLADIEAVWPFDWLVGLKGALPCELISEKQFPKVFAWIERFNKAIKAAKASAPKPTTVKGEAALQRITNARFADAEVAVDEHDPLGLRQGEEVEVWPTDSGFRHRDHGRLVGLTPDEVVLSVASQAEQKEVRLHFPRTNFRIKAVKDASVAKL